MLLVHAPTVAMRFLNADQGLVVLSVASEGETRGFGNAHHHTDNEGKER
jgi:hypothetical protein